MTHRSQSSIDDSATGDSLHGVDVPWRAVRRDRDDTTHVGERGPDVRGSGRKCEGDSGCERTIEPALQNGRLPTPPGGVHEDESVAPLQIVEVSGELRFGRGGVEMSALLGESEARVELLGVQIPQPYVVSTST